MFKNLFGKNNEEQYEPAAPVVEKRKQERFSEPLIYNDEVKEEPKVEAVKTTYQAPPKKKETYQMSQVISPILGSSKTKEEEKKKPSTKKKYHYHEPSLVSVISPFYGDPEEEEEDILVEEFIAPVEQVKEPTVEDNLRNFARLVEEEQNELKIIEQRTGEFKLDFSGANSEKEPSLIDEIEDDMSLDELMSLYEKKFND